MRTARKTIWGGVVIFTILSSAFLLVLEKQGAQFSVSGRGASEEKKIKKIITSERMPIINASPVAIIGGGSAQGGITLRGVLPYIERGRMRVFAIRSVSEIYPDGTSERFEVLYVASTSTHKLTVGAGGVKSDTPFLGNAPLASSLPLDFPDSSDALLQLTANPYFAKAYVIGIALYFDGVAKKWNYVVRTNLGDVTILLPLARPEGSNK